MTKPRNRKGKHSSSGPKRKDLIDQHPTSATHISAPEAERLGLYPDWPTWPLGRDLVGTWEWLLQQVEAGYLPDVPCRWSENVSAERAAIYWLDTAARTRHLVVGYGHLVLTCPAPNVQTRSRMH